MKKYLVIVMFLMSQSLYAATTIKAEVNGMVCAFCAKGIEKKLNALPQGQAAFVDLKSRLVLLELKDNQTVTEEAFKKIIQDAGYSVSHYGLENKSIAEIKATLVKAK
jgi:copper chaperone CopZ